MAADCAIILVGDTLEYNGWQWYKLDCAICNKPWSRTHMESQAHKKKIQHGPNQFVTADALELYALLQQQNAQREMAAHASCVMASFVPAESFFVFNEKKKVAIEKRWHRLEIGDMSLPFPDGADFPGGCVWTSLPHAPSSLG